MQRVKEGNLQEMATLFERYHVRMFNFFLRMAGDRSLSQDLTQNLFYRILKYRSSYKEGNCFKSWMFQMARNIYYDYCHEHKKQNDHFTGIETCNVEISDTSDAYSQDDYDRLDAALAKLETGQREIIILSRYQGLRYEEISKITDISVGSIKVQMHRAIKQLRTLYFKLQNI
jgi:RNA polymerase sigma-70 factor (ECF subfamily)